MVMVMVMLMLIPMPMVTVMAVMCLGASFSRMWSLGYGLCVVSVVVLC